MKKSAFIAALLLSCSIATAAGVATQPAADAEVAQLRQQVADLKKANQLLQRQVASLHEKIAELTNAANHAATPAPGSVPASPTTLTIGMSVDQMKKIGFLDEKGIMGELSADESGQTMTFSPNGPGNSTIYRVRISNGKLVSFTLVAPGHAEETGPGITH